MFKKKHFPSEADFRMVGRATVTSSSKCLSYRELLLCVHPKCYVEAGELCQGGTVVDIIRNRDGLPVCLKVESGKKKEIDYISVDRVTFYEPWQPMLQKYMYDSDYYESDEAFEDYLQEKIAEEKTEEKRVIGS